ncbi:MAG: hypothetical protein BRD50_05825, partial [Bacteroidetes bacterium SW_11_45_7]
MTYRSISQNMTLVLTVLVMITGVATLQSCKDKEGCTDPNAINYDSDAEEDDGSCKYENSFASDTLESNIESAMTLSSNTYICGRIQVNAGLTIEEGVTLSLCSGAEIRVNKGSYLQASGTSAKPITIQGEVDTKGFWKVIEINSNNPKNVLENVQLSNGGGDSFWNNAMVFVNNNNNAQLKVTNTTFSQSKGYGLYAQDGTELNNFSNNTFSNNGKEGLRITADLIDFLDTETTYNNNNDKPYILVNDNGSIEKNQTWRNTSSPYLIKGDVDVNAQVTVQAGTNVRMGSGSEIHVNQGAAFNAEGTSSDKITFKGKTETGGFWRVIEINSNNPENVFRNVEFHHGGSDDFWDHSTIYVNDNNNGSLDMKNSTIRQSGGWGMYVQSNANVTPSDSTSMVSQNTFTNNGALNAA